MSSHRKELLLQLLLCNSNPSGVACDVECENTSRRVGIVFFGLTVAFFRRNFTGQVHGNVFGHFEVKMPRVDVDGYGFWLGQGFHTREI